MPADDDRNVRVREQHRAGQQLIGGCREGVLVGPAVDGVAHQLLGSRVGHGADDHVGGGQSALASVGQLTGNAEVTQQDSSFAVTVGDQDVGGLDVAVQ